jgi:hypothetical protein
MTTNSSRFLNLNVGAAVVLAGLLAAACTPIYSAPEQVETQNPSVTYKYNTDQELVQANQNASTYCNRYQSVPRTTNFSSDPDGSKVVVFDCV